MKTGTLLQGHVLDVLKSMPGESVDCICTSPPYYGLPEDFAFDPLRSWKRARIPVFLAQAIAKAAAAGLNTLALDLPLPVHDDVPHLRDGG